MPIADVIMLNIARIFDRTRDHKNFHKNTKKHNISYFPNLTNYENFLKATNKSIWFVMAFVHYNLYLNKLHCSKNVFYANSMSITVCKNRYISSHKVSKGFANREEINKSMFFRLQTAWNLHHWRHFTKTEFSSEKRTWQLVICCCYLSTWRNIRNVHRLSS